jgi:hypothetical protein
MQAVDRVVISNNWVTLVFVVALVLLFVLKTTHQSKLIELSKAFFVKGFIEKKIEEKEVSFSLFNCLLFIFSAIVFSLLILVVIGFVFDFEVFNRVLFGVVLYLLFFNILDFLLGKLFNIRNEIAHFVIAKKTYVFNTAIWLFPFLIVAIYGFDNLYFISSVFLFLFGMSVALMVFNNKNLILNKLFYFILYLCALEIAPLLIIYKIMV